MSALVLHGSVRTPRVLFVATSRGEGGIERYSVQLATQIQARGVETLFVCAPSSYIEQAASRAGVPVHLLHLRNSGDLRAAHSLAGTMRAFGADIVHAHSRRDYVSSALAVSQVRLCNLNRKSPSLLLHAHLDRPLGVPHALSGQFFRATADRVIAVSQAVQRTVTSSHGLDPRFVPVIYNGIDIDRFSPSQISPRPCQRLAVRSRLGIPEDVVVVGMLGRLDCKGQDRLLTLIPRLLNHRKTMRFVIAGPGDPASLQTAAAALGVTDRVSILAGSCDATAMLPAFDILLHLPQSESFGLALAEAMACRIPVITTDVGGCPEVVQDGVTGIVVNGACDPEIERAILDLSDETFGADRRLILGDAGKDMVAQRFSLSAQVDRIYALYCDVADANACWNTV